MDATLLVAQGKAHPSHVKISAQVELKPWGEK